MNGSRAFCPRVSACLLLLVGAAAAAQDAESPWYVAGHLGATFTEDADLRSDIVLANFPTAEFVADLPFKRGWGGGMTVGREFGDNWRLEGEIFRRQAAPDAISVRSTTVGEFDITDTIKTIFETGGEGGGPAFVVGGRMKFLSFMLNGFYDMSTPWPVRPYVGLGVGMVKRTMHKHVEIHLPASFGATADFIEDEHEDAWDFMFQVQAGVGIPLRDALELELGYRYKALPAAALHFFQDGEGGAAPMRAEINASHSVDVGLLWRF